MAREQIGIEYLVIFRKAVGDVPRIIAEYKNYSEALDELKLAESLSPSAYIIIGTRTLFSKPEAVIEKSEAVEAKSGKEV